MLSQNGGFPLQNGYNRELYHLCDDPYTFAFTKLQKVELGRTCTRTLLTSSRRCFVKIYMAKGQLESLNRDGKDSAVKNSH
jgi:hypothetical protein